MRILHLIISILALQVLAISSGPVSAQEPLRVLAADVPEQQSSSSSSISDIEQQIRMYDRQIFLELVKLAEFNVLYQQTVNHCARWRKVVYPLAQEATYACFLGYSLTDISQSARGWNAPSRISRAATRKGLSSAMVGALLGSTSSIVELAANGAESLHANRKGFSVRKSVSFVQAVVKQVDDMLTTRHALMEEGEFTGTRRELFELKEQLLKYERDRLVFEFKRWSAHSRGYFWYKNAFYLINATVNLGRFSAVQLGFASFRQPKCIGATGPILIASACLAGVGPVASSTVGNCMQRHQEQSLSKTIPVAPFLSDELAKQKFERLAQLLASSDTINQHSKLTSELVRLREEKVGLDTLIYHQEKNIQRFRRVAGQQAITAPMISSLGAGSAVLNTIAYQAYRQKPLTSNRLGLAADAAVIPAEAIALVATPVSAIQGYVYERDLKKKGEHPEQVLSSRLKELKELEEMVTDAWR